MSFIYFKKAVSLLLLLNYLTLCKCKEKSPDEQVSELNKELYSEPNNAHLHVIKDLQKLTKTSSKALPVIIGALSHPEDIFVEQAIEALGEIKPPSNESISSLFDFLVRKSDKFSSKAELSLKKMGEPALHFILDCAKGTNIERKKAAILLIGKWRIYDARPLLIEILFGDNQYKNEEIREHAIDALIRIKPDDFRTFSKYIDNEDPKMKFASRELLYSYGEEILPFWIERANSDISEEKLNECIIGLGSSGRESLEATQLLANIMSDPKQNWLPRQYATWELAESEIAIDPLLNKLTTDDEKTLFFIFEAFERMGKKNPFDLNAHETKIIKKLRPFLEHKNSKIKISAAWAIGYVCRTENLREISENHSDEEVREIYQKILSERE